MANSAVSAAAGGKIAPFFRFPYLAQPPRILSYFAERNIAIFSGDIDSRDYTMHKPEPVVDSVMSQLEKRGQGYCAHARYTPQHRRRFAGTAPAAKGRRLQGRAHGPQGTNDEMFEHRENLSPSVQPASATAPANVAAAHHKGSMYMYAPAQGRGSRQTSLTQ
jgi:hypothetical protein